MIAFHGSLETKAKFQARVELHRAADQLIQGNTWNANTQKGCAIGCTLHSYDHSRYESELGIPRALARLEDRIFEGLSVEESRDWPGQFLAAIPPGADLSMVWPQFAHWLLVDPEHGVIKFAKRDQSKSAITKVGELYRRWIDGDKPSQEEWRADAAAAYAAAYAADADAAAAAAYADAAAAYAAAYADAADAAADAAAAYADAAAAYAAAYAADAADAAAYAYAAGADAAAAYARRSARSVQAKKLLALLSAAPIP